MIKQCLALLVVFCGLVGASEAQTLKKDSVLTAMAKDMCSKLKGTDLSKMSPEKLQMQLSMLMMPVMTDHLEGLQEVYDLSSIDEQTMQKIGLEMGMKLSQNCPEFLMLMAPAAQKNAANTAPAIAAIKTEATQTFSGTLVRIVTGEFTYFEVKNAGGKTEKIWWFENFEGADKLAAQNLNKKVTVTYTEKEVYKAVLKEYVKIKVATGIQ
jgi:hypothetical protein